MRKLWLIAKQEYLKIVRKRSFLIGTLGMPLLIGVIMLISIVLSLGGRGDIPVGYVDYAGVLQSAVLPVLEQGERMVALQGFTDESVARAALEAGEIQALYIVPVDYLDTGQITLYFLSERPGERVREDFRDFLQANLLAGQPEAIRYRVQQGANLVLRSIDGNRELDMQNPVSFFLPFVAAFFFIFAVMNAGGYMLEAVTDERENRTIEVLATSVRPLQLMGGKAVGLMAVGLTQLLLWSGTGLAGLLVIAAVSPVLQGARMPWSLLVVITLFFIPAYALIAGLMTAIGSIFTDTRQAQQITGIINMFFTAPFFFITIIFTRPSSPLITALTLFPTTSFITIALRWAVVPVPLWQLVISWVLLTASALTSVWFAARVFRLGMLLYGQRLRLPHIVADIKRRA
ncbi:MAG: ABC transporter permease [Anaerolineae bacterium]|nr:ABC transporter permease [Anaerolineae bacterium]